MMFMKKNIHNYSAMVKLKTVEYGALALNTCAFLPDDKIMHPLFWKYKTLILNVFTMFKLKRCFYFFHICVFWLFELLCPSPGAKRSYYIFVRKIINFLLWASFIQILFCLLLAVVCYIGTFMYAGDKLAIQRLLK